MHRDLNAATALDDLKCNFGLREMAYLQMQAVSPDHLNRRGGRGIVIERQDCNGVLLGIAQQIDICLQAGRSGTTELLHFHPCCPTTIWRFYVFPLDDRRILASG